MMDWRHTNNILQANSWRCLIVSVKFHALMTSPMTSPGHKVGQILKLLYLHNISARALTKISKYRKCSWFSYWYIQLPVLLPVKKFVASSKWRPFWHIKHSFNLTADIKISSQIMSKTVFFMVMTLSVTPQGGLKSALYIPLWMK